MAARPSFWLLLALVFFSVFPESFANVVVPFMSSQMAIKSLRQKVISPREIFFSGNVDFLVEGRFHIFADKLYFDNKKKIAYIQAEASNSIVMQDERMLVFASYCQVNIESGEIHLCDAQVQIVEGFFRADRFFRDNTGDWWAQNISYTPCDAHIPHWQIQASEGFYTSSYLKLEQIKFFMNKSPIAWLPGVIVPLAQKSNSGFLVPRLSLDRRYGLGVRQNYYWYIHDHADATIGIDWKNARGVFGTGEYRWAGTPQHVGFFKGYGGYVENVYLQRRGNIVQTGRPAYWLQGKHTYGTPDILGFSYLSTLCLLDNGTSKKTGYEFFDRLEDVDDVFYNGFLCRGYTHSGLALGSIDFLETSRKRFFIVPSAKIFTQEEQEQFLLDQPIEKVVQEFDNRSEVYHLPQFTWAGMLKKAGCFSYKDFYLADYAFMREQETERIFLLSKLAREERIIPRAWGDAFRMEYQGDASLHIPTLLGTFYMTVSPCVSLRSKVHTINPQNMFPVKEHQFLANGAYRAQLKSHSGCFFPSIECLDELGYTTLELQPQVQFQSAPFVAQEGWFLFDRFDRSYPTQQIAFLCDYRINVKKTNVFWGYVKQGYDFIPQDKWFSLRQSGISKAMTPFEYSAAYESNAAACFLSQEYCPIQRKLLTSFIHSKIFLGENELHLGYLFQDGTTSRVRKLLTQSPHTFFIGTAVPIGRRLRVEYGGFFSLEQSVVGLNQLMLMPIKHELKLEYRGHCWGFYMGIEEKYYRQYGNNKHDQAFIFSVYVDSLGSFAKKIKSNSSDSLNSVFK